MDIIDKRNILKSMGSNSPCILELGCGPKKKNPQAIGVDALDYECVDIVGDVFSVLAKIPDDAVNEVQSYHFFEHIGDIGSLVDEIGRVLKPGGSLLVVVPHFSNPYFYSDYTHRTFFGLYTFSYLATDRIFKRKVPNYQRKFSFYLGGAELVFYSPFRMRGKFKRLIGKLVNMNSYTKEFYEENLSHIIPCYEIRYRLIKPI